MKKLLKILPIVLVIWPIINLIIQINMKRWIDYIIFIIMEVINIAFMIIYLKKNKKIDMLYVNVLISIYLLTSLFIPVYFYRYSDSNKRTEEKFKFTPDYYDEVVVFKYNIYGIDISGIDIKLFDWMTV